MLEFLRKKRKKEILAQLSMHLKKKTEEENIGVNLPDLGLGNNFLNGTKSTKQQKKK